MIAICLAISLNLTDLLAPVPSHAPTQQRVGSGGHALDRNLRLGSGGYNRRTISQRSQFHRPTYRIGISPARRLGYTNDAWSSKYPGIHYQRSYDPLRSSTSFNRAYGAYSVPMSARTNFRR